MQVTTSKPLTLAKLPPLTPVRRIYNDTLPCQYCGSLTDTCSDLDCVKACPSMRAKIETDKLLKDLRDTQNYRLST